MSAKKARRGRIRSSDQWMRASDVRVGMSLTDSDGFCFGTVKAMVRHQTRPLWYALVVRDGKCDVLAFQENATMHPGRASGVPIEVFAALASVLDGVEIFGVVTLPGDAPAAGTTREPEKLPADEPDEEDEPETLVDDLLPEVDFLMGSDKGRIEDDV